MNSKAARRLTAVCLVLGMAAVGCSSQPVSHSGAPPSQTGRPTKAVAERVAEAPATAPAKKPPSVVSPPFRHPLPGMPPVQNGEVYAGARAGNGRPGSGCPRLTPQP